MTDTPIWLHDWVEVMPDERSQRPAGAGQVVAFVSGLHLVSVRLAATGGLVDVPPCDLCVLNGETD